MNTQPPASGLPVDLVDLIERALLRAPCSCRRSWNGTPIIPICDRCVALVSVPAVRERIATLERELERLANQLPETVAAWQSEQQRLISLNQAEMEATDAAQAKVAQLREALLDALPFAESSRYQHTCDTSGNEREKSEVVARCARLVDAAPAKESCTHHRITPECPHCAQEQTRG